MNKITKAMFPVAGLGTRFLKAKVDRKYTLGHSKKLGFISSNI